MIISSQKLNQLKSVIQRSILPGEYAQMLMAPASRLTSSLARMKSDNYREASIALILFKEKQHIKFILIQRNTYDGVHSGEMGFPGGKKEASDINSFHTAQRETFEEIGLNLNQCQFFGLLTPVFVLASNFNINAHVFYIDHLPELTLDQREVASVHFVKVSDLLDDSKKKIIDLEHYQGYKLKNVPYYDFDGKVVWGATALILSEFEVLLKSNNLFL